MLQNYETTWPIFDFVAFSVSVHGWQKLAGSVRYVSRSDSVYPTYDKVVKAKR